MASIWAKMAPPFNFPPQAHTIPHAIGKFNPKGFVGTMPLALDCFVTKCNIGMGMVLIGVNGVNGMNSIHVVHGVHAGN